MLAVRSVARLGQPLKVILTDYVEVTKDIFKGARRRPLKAALYLSSMAAFTLAWKKRPDYASYVDDVLNYSNELGMCSEAVRKPSAKQYIDTVAQLHEEGSLRYVNLGIVGVVLRRDHCPSCSNYHVTCKHLQPRWWTIGERVVDVGFWGTWRTLEQEMIDFDINDEELQKSLES